MIVSDKFKKMIYDMYVDIEENKLKSLREITIGKDNYLFKKTENKND